MAMFLLLGQIFVIHKDDLMTGRWLFMLFTRAIALAWRRLRQVDVQLDVVELAG